MRKFRMLLGCAFLLCCHFAQSQVTDFKLTDYKYRAPLYQSLQLNIDMSQNMNTNNERAITYDQKSFGAGLVADVGYLRSVSTEMRQSTRMTGISTTSNFFSSKTNGQKSKNNRISGGLVYSANERIWYKEKSFFEVGGRIGGSGLTSKTGIALDNSTITNTEVSGSVYGGIGKGRLEYVHDAQTALFILQDLYDAGIIKNKQNKETVNRFAQLITNIKKRRVLDGRRRTIFMLTQIDSFMRSNRMVNDCDAKTMAIINDNLFYGFTNDLSGNLNILGDQSSFDWARARHDEGFEGLDYGLIPQIEPYTDQMFRQHGTVMYARLIPDIYRRSDRMKSSKSGLDSTVKTHTTLFRPTILLGYEKHIPVNLNHQKYYKAFCEFYFTKTKGQNLLLNEQKGVRLTGIYGLGYYPNSRTLIEGEGSLDLDFSSWNKTKEFMIAPAIHIRSGYFLNYNTVLRGTFRVSYYTYTKSKQNFMDEILKISLLHYFF